MSETNGEQTFFINADENGNILDIKDKEDNINNGEKNTGLKYFLEHFKNGTIDSCEQTLEYEDQDKYDDEELEADLSSRIDNQKFYGPEITTEQSVTNNITHAIRDKLKPRV
jgi:hypothetical protein